MPLFEVAILEHPTKAQAKDGAEERLVLRPTVIVARDQQAAAIGTVMDNPEMQIDRSRMEVLVRPFA